MISVIIPDYKNPKYLDMCLKSATENQIENQEIIVVVDGIYDGYKEVTDKYTSKIQVLPLQKNKGLAYALNIGVSQASNDYVLLVNEDNVFPKHWDVAAENDTYSMGSGKDCIDVISYNQIEPNPSMYGFVTLPYGDSLETFKYDWFLEYELKLRGASSIKNCGVTFPFLISKNDYMGVGGFDLMYPSPFVVDWDFFYKLQLMNKVGMRSYRMNFYHFVNKSTKKKDDITAQEQMKFINDEHSAMEIFKYKWGAYPIRSKQNNWKIKFNT